jgi:hypothetical protein
VKSEQISAGVTADNFEGVHLAIYIFVFMKFFFRGNFHMILKLTRYRTLLTRLDNMPDLRGCNPKVSELAAWSENYKWYSSLCH